MGADDHRAWGTIRSDGAARHPKAKPSGIFRATKGALVLQDNRVYFKEVINDNQCFELAFNGNALQTGNCLDHQKRRRTDPVLTTYGANADPTAEMFSCEWLSAIGFDVPGRAGDLGKPVTSTILNAAGRAENVKCNSDEAATTWTIATSASSKTVEYVVDPAKSWSVTYSRGLNSAGDVLFEVVPTRLAPIRPDLWLPTEVTIKRYCLPNRDQAVSKTPVYTERYLISVTSNDMQPTSQFELRYNEPGVIVVDRASEQARESQSGAIVSEIPAPDENVEETTGRLGGWRVALLAANAIGVGLLIAYLVVTRRSQA